MIQETWCWFINNVYFCDRMSHVVKQETPLANDQVVKQKELTVVERTENEKKGLKFEKWVISKFPATAMRESTRLLGNCCYLSYIASSVPLISSHSTFTLSLTDRSSGVMSRLSEVHAEASALQWMLRASA